MVTAKARTEEARAVSGKVTSPKELTAIQEEVASLKRRQGTLEDELLELMEQRETLEAELAELATRREGFTAEQAEVTKARDAALVEIDRELDGERAARDGVAPGGGRAAARPLRPGPLPPGRGRGGRPGRQHLPGLPGVDLPGRAGRHPQAPAEEIKRCENCRRILVVEVEPGLGAPRRRGRLDRRRGQGQPGAGRLRGGRWPPPAARCWPRWPRGSAGRPTTWPSTGG